MRKSKLALMAIALLALLILSPRASAWTDKTHGRQVEVAFDALPDDYKAGFDDSLLYSASIAPNDWRYDGGQVQQGKSYSASSSSSGHGPEQAFDGNPNTYWEAGITGPGENIEVDLGTAYPIIKISFRGVENEPNVMIQYSSNDTNWYTAGTVNNVQHVELIDLENMNYQYWRLKVSSISSGSRFKVNEIEIYAAADEEHTATYSRDMAAYWLQQARNSLLMYNDKSNALYYMGIAAHYIGDAMTLVHNNNLWDDAIAGEWPSGWTLHEHFEEQVRYHEPATPSVQNYRSTVEEYTYGYLYSYLDNFWGRAENDWSYWKSTRDGDYVKSCVDNATQLIYDAWVSLLYEKLGPPAGGFSAAASEQMTQTSSQEGVGLSLASPITLWATALFSLLMIIFIIKRSPPRRKLRRDERGITPVVGGVLVISLIVVASITIITSWIPEYELKNEADHMDTIRSTWQELQLAILNHENKTIKVKMSADEASVFGLFGQPMNPGYIGVTPAKFVARLLPKDDTYVNEDGTPLSGNDELLWVQSHLDNNRRAFFKFDLSDLPEDAIISEARFIVYTMISKFQHTHEGVTGSSDVPALLEVKNISNDDWDEGLPNPPTWSWPELGEALNNDDPPYANTWEISSSDVWHTFNLSYHVKEQRNLDNLVSLCIKSAEEDSILQRHAIFWSKESDYHRPYLLVTYERASGAGEPIFNDDWGTLADGGSIVFEANNKHYGRHTFAFESGGLIKEQEDFTFESESLGQQGGMHTLMISNPNLIVAERTADDNIKIYVNRYRIVNRTDFSSRGEAVMHVYVWENTDLRKEYNLDNITIALRSDYPSAWRGDDPLISEGYFTDLAVGTGGDWGSLDYLLEAGDSDGNDIATAEFYPVAVTIKGRHLGPTLSGSGNLCPVTPDIIFVERVYDVRIDITLT